MKIKIIAFISIFGLVSCDTPDSPTAKANTARWLKNPGIVGSLPDGRIVKYIVRDMGSKDPHYIYFVDGVTTTNQNIQVGKTIYNQVTVEIDGIKYVPLEENK